MADATVAIIKNAQGQDVFFEGRGGIAKIRYRVTGGGSATNLDLPFNRLSRVLSVEGPVNDFEPAGGTLIDTANRVVKITAPAGLTAGQTADFTLVGVGGI